MANNTGLKPFFLTGANAKLKIDGITLGYCAELQFGIQITSAGPKILGMVESDTIETLAYDVGGSFAMVRYADKVKERAGTAKVPSGINPNGTGNGIGLWRKDNVLLSELIGGKFFDLEVFQKTIGITDTVSVFTIKKCKIMGINTVISKRAIAMQSFSFRGCYQSEDTLINDSSKTWGPNDVWTPTSGDGTT